MKIPRDGHSAARMEHGVIQRAETPFGPYTLLHPLGVGGMGEVYLARHTGDHGIKRLVALKRILEHLTQQQKLVTLFLDEVRLVSQLNHSNIVQVLDHGVINGRYYMAMEYVHGEDLVTLLKRLFKRGERLPLDLVLYMASSVCEGLDYAHSKADLDHNPLGIVHRDITPHNILLSFQGEVKVADFGVARAAEQSHQTLGGELKGKISYMSPEQAYGHRLDHRSDLFSLGIVLYETLTGKSPFLRRNQMATLEAVRAGEFPRPSQFCPDMPPELETLLCRVLHKSVEQRPSSARAMHDELQQIMRLYNMVPSAFDLADYLRDVFPESRPESGMPQEEKTAVGRRADAVSSEQATICYLRKRDGEPEPPASQVPTLKDLPIRRWPRVMLIVALLLGSAGILAYLGLTPDSPPYVPSRATAPKIDASAADASLHEAAAAATASLSASLTFKTTPSGARVTISGKRQQGSTPMTLELSPGPQPYVLTHKGYKRKRGEVTLRSGESQHLTIKLEALPTLVNIRSTHPCKIRINGAMIGKTPITGHRARRGALVIRCDTLTPGAQAVKRLKATPGTTKTIMFRFGVLAINVEPWAEVRVNGKARGATPLRVLLPEGEHQVQLSNKSRADLRRRMRITISADRTTHISNW